MRGRAVAAFSTLVAECIRKPDTCSFSGFRGSARNPTSRPGIRSTMTVSLVIADRGRSSRVDSDGPSGRVSVRPASPRNVAGDRSPTARDGYNDVSNTVKERLNRRQSRRLRTLQRQGEPERAAVVGVACRPQAAAVRLDDRAADREAHAEAVWLGAEEGLEDVRRRVGNATAAVADGHLDARRARRGGGGDGQRALLVARGLHGLDAVQQEIEQDL